MTATMTSLGVYVSCERMNFLSREGWLKLVLLEWSESEYDGKFGFSMLQIFEPLAQPVAFDSIFRFLLDDTCK